MGAIRKQTVYRLSVLVWGLAVFGAMVLVVSGNAAPYVPVSDLPTRDPIALFGGVVGLWLLGALVVGRLSRRDWKRVGRRAGLDTAGGGLLGKPDLEGTVRGRTVRMRTIKRNTGSGGEGGTSKTTYTVVEAELDAPVDDGVMILVAADAEALDGLGEGGLRTTDVGGVGVIGAEEEFARAVLTGRVREQLREPSGLDSVFVGDVSDTLLAGLPGGSGGITGMVTGAIERKVEGGTYGDATTVRVQRKGVLLDETELTRRIDALLAVAESYEAARVDRGDAPRRRGATTRDAVGE